MWGLIKSKASKGNPSVAMSLLDTALERKMCMNGSKSKEATLEEVELAVAFAEGRVTMSQVSYALNCRYGPNSRHWGGKAYVVLLRGLKKYVQDNKF